MKKRMLSVIIAAALIFSLSLSAYATEYSDLSGHWAKSYMEDLATRGYLTGYSDGTMKPDKNMTAGEALVVLSRLYSLNELESTLVEEDYKSTVTSLVSSSLSWAYTYLEKDLAAGIITQSELKSTDLTADIKKEQLAVFLVRAMQLTDAAAALDSTDISFADTSKITSADIGSVAELYSIGIVKGDENNKFNPSSSVTRAVVATMISRALTYLETNSLTLVISSYEGMTQELGLISSVSTSSVDVCGFDGLIREYSMSSGSAVTVDNSTGTLGSTYVGYYATVTARYGIVRSLAIDSKEKWMQGVVSSVSTTSTENKLYIKTALTDKTETFIIPTTATITRDNISAKIASIVSGDFVTIEYSGSNALTICDVSKSASITGSITKLTLGSTITMVIEDTDGVSYAFYLNITDLPTIKRGNTEITIDRLKTGNTVTVTYKGNEATAIVTSGTGDTVSGTLVSSSTTSGGTKWILSVNGSEVAYMLDEDVTVYKGTTSISLSDIAVGDSVTVTVFNDTITDISLTGTVAASTEVSGTVLAVSSADSLVTILNSENKLIYLDTSTLVSIIVAKTGGSAYLSSITQGSTITAYGSYSSSTKFATKAIIIQNVA